MTQVMDDATIGIDSGWTSVAELTAATFSAIGPGAVIGSRYEIIRLLGEGGMGAVYEARDRELDRIVAFKVVRPEYSGNAEMLRLFKQELILARQVTHKNVIRIYDLGTAEGLRFITMPFVEGHDLKSVVRNKGKLKFEESAAIIAQVCEGLDAAHKEGVIHRDLKPQNIMVDDQGKALVMDFGLALSSDSDASGKLLGTPDYMSPEQAAKQPIDGRSDLYTVGIILFELLTGRLPFETQTLAETLEKRMTQPVQPPIEIDPSIPKPLSDLVVKCMAIDPAARYQTAAEIVYDLHVWLGIIVPASSRKWKIAAAASAVVVVVLAGTTVFLSTRKPPAEQKPVTVLVADFNNETGEPLLNGTLEPAVGIAMEGASFVNAYNRVQARQIAGQVKAGSNVLDENMARLVAVREGINVVLAGSVSKGGSGYRVQLKALDPSTGKDLGRSDARASDKDKLLAVIPRLTQPLRKALGDKNSSAKSDTGETVTASSLEAAHSYSLGQDAQLSARYEEAINHYRKALQLDSNIGRAYSGLGVIYRNLGDREEAEKNLKIALSHIGKMSERERYRTRGAYYVTIGSYEKAADEYNTLVKQFPADNAGHANLAICYLYLRNLPKAIEEGRKAIDIYPKNVAQRNNLAGYLLYAGRFQDAIKEADEVLKLNPAFERAHVIKALASLALGNRDKAVEFYAQAGKASPRGASYQATGMADLALYEGRPAEAVTLLREGIDADEEDGKEEWAGPKYVALANANLQLGKKAPAIAAADAALKIVKEDGLRFLTARTYIEAGQEAKARTIAQSLSKRLESVPQAYGKLIEGNIALKNGDIPGAVKTMQEARKLVDTWAARFELGRAYLKAEAYTEADSEFDACIRRRGEATALFFDVSPTFSYYPAAYYYLGRAQEGLSSPAAAESYRSFLAMKTSANGDPLVTDARKRAAK